MDPEALPAGGPREIVITEYGTGTGTMPFKLHSHLSCDVDYDANGVRTRVNVRLDGGTIVVPERQLELYRAAPSTPRTPGEEMVTVRVELGRGAKATYRVPKSALR